MKPLNKSAINELNKQFLFYDFNTFRGSKNIQVDFSEDFGVVRFGDLEYGANLNDYKTRENLLCKFLLRLISLWDRGLVLKKYEEKWVVNEELSKELYKELQKNHVEKNVAAISLDRTSPWIKLFIKAALKYNSFFQFLFPLEKIVLTVTDHMDIFISAENSANFQWVEDIIEEINQKEKVFTIIEL